MGENKLNNIISSGNPPSDWNINQYVFAACKLCDAVNDSGDILDIYLDIKPNEVLNKLLEPHNKFARTITDTCFQYQGDVSFALITFENQTLETIIDIVTILYNNLTENGRIILNPKNGNPLQDYSFLENVKVESYNKQCFSISRKKNKSSKVISIEELRHYDKDDPWILTGVQNWGDGIIILEHLMAQHNSTEVGAFCAFRYDDTFDFFAEQKIIKNVFNINDHIPWLENKQRLCDRFQELAEREFPQIMIRESYAYLHLIKEIPAIPPPNTFVLPQSSLNFANNFAKYLPQKFVILQPYSTTSTKLDGHWSGWAELMQRLPTYFPDTLFLIFGINQESAEISAPNILNLTHCASSMQNLFAIADKASYIVTTSNSLSHWARLQRLHHTVFSCVGVEVWHLWKALYSMPCENSSFMGITTPIDRALHDIATKMYCSQ